MRNTINSSQTTEKTKSRSVVKQNTPSNYIKTIDISGIGIFNEPFKYNIKNTNFEIIKLGAKKGKTTLIKSILFSLFNENFQYLRSFKKYNEFYSKIYFYIKDGKKLLIVNKNKENNLLQELNKKIKDEFKKKDIEIYFNFLKEIRKSIYINIDKLNEPKFSILKKNEELEKYKKEKKEIKINNLISIFENETELKLDTDLEQKINEINETYLSLIEEKKKEYARANELLKEEYIKEENLKKLLEQLSNVESKISKESLKEIYKKINEILVLYYKYKNFDYSKNKISKKEIKELKFKILKILDLEKIEKTIKKLIFDAIKNNDIGKIKIYFDEEKYNEFSNLVDEIYRLIIKLENYQEKDEIKEDIKNLMILNDKNSKDFNLLKEKFVELENILIEDNEIKLEKFIEELINSEDNYNLLITLIKKYNNSLLFFIPLIDEISKIKKVSNIFKNELYTYILKMFNIKNENNYESLINSSYQINSINYKLLCKIVNQFIDLIDNKHNEKKEEIKNIILNEIASFFNKIYNEIKKEIEEFEYIYFKENQNEENDKENDELKKIIGYQYKNKQILMENKLNIEVNFFDEIELTFFKYINKLIEKKEKYETLIEEHINISKNIENLKKELELINNEIDNLFNKYIKEENNLFEKEDLPKIIDKNIKKTEEEYENKKRKYYLYKDKKEKTIEKIKNIEEFYSSEEYNIINDDNEMIKIINTLISNYLKFNIEFLNENGMLYVIDNEEETKIPIEIVDIFKRLIFRIFNLLVINNYLRLENENLILLIDNIDKELTEEQLEELEDLLKFISNDFKLQIIFTKR